MKSNSTAFLIKIKLRHSLGRPSRSDFVQSEVLYKVHNWVIYGNAIYHLYPENANLELELFRDNGVMIIQDRFYDSLEKIEEKIIEYKEV